MNIRGFIVSVFHKPRGEPFVTSLRPINPAFSGMLNIFNEEQPLELYESLRGQESPDAARR